MPSAVALVPARSGSQRVPGKNVAPLAGHPLIAYAIAGACESGVFDEVVVSTDSEGIAELAEHDGATVPGLRPAQLATATSPVLASSDLVRSMTAARCLPRTPCSRKNATASFSCR